MQIPSRLRKKQQGSVLIVGVIVAFVMGITLASYLYLTRNETASVARSQVWNASIPLAESGVEDALAMMNLYNGDFDKLLTWTNSTTLTSSGWANLGGGVYYVRRYVGNNYYDVYITNSYPEATIYSVGTVTWNKNYASAAFNGMAVVNSPSQQSGATTLNRKLRIRAKIDPVFNVAMAALKEIDFSGKNVSTDSFDSIDPLYSTNGMYPLGVVSMTKAGGDVVSDDTIINTLSVGNATIKGSVKTGPKGTITIGPNGSVGDKAWVEGGSKGIQAGHSSDDMNVVFPMPTLPSGSYLAPPSGTVNGVTYGAILDSGNYYLASWPSKVLVRGNAKLWVNTSINMTGNDVIVLQQNSALKMYMQGASAKFAGNGIVNSNGNAASFYYFGLVQNTSVNMAGNAAFTGVIYAPNADFSLGGGGNNTYDFVGSSVTKSVKMNGHFNFHYDENLRRNGMGRGYIPSDWKEM